MTFKFFQVLSSSYGKNSTTRKTSTVYVSFLQFLKEELCEHLGLMLIPTREQVNIIISFVRHTKILGNSGEK